MSTSNISNRLGAVRAERGFSASELARRVGVSRQTIYAMEGGSYVPNTAVALQLAQVLQSSVEELFFIPQAGHGVTGPTTKAEVLPGAAELRAGEAVQLAAVDGRWFAVPATPQLSFLPPSDGVLARTMPRARKATFHPHGPKHGIEDRLLVASCDPAMSLLAQHLERAGYSLVLVPRNSSEALRLLKRGSVHVAGTHLHDEKTGGGNVAVIRKTFPNQNSVACVSFAVWEEGLVVARGNPKAIKKAEDLLRRNVRIVNREAGSGSRMLLDRALERAGGGGKRPRGYDTIAAGHLAAASLVNAGRADCCVATRGSARAFGLDFVSWQTERVDLAIRKEHLALPAMQALFDTLQRAAFRDTLQNLGGYDTSVSGARLL